MIGCRPGHEEFELKAFRATDAEPPFTCDGGSKAEVETSEGLTREAPDDFEGVGVEQASFCLSAVAPLTALELEYVRAVE